jgi:hypothetical protein
MGHHLLLFFMSLHPTNLSHKENKLRQLEYLTSIGQIKRLTNGFNWKVIYCENTLGSLEKLEASAVGMELKSQLLSISSSNRGEANKGIGELSMMINAYKSYSNLFDSATTVSYFTGRRIMTSRYLLERTEKLTKKALISNPDFLFFDGAFVPSEKNNMYNDMFFTMGKETFTKFVNFTESSLFSRSLGNEVIGSEQNLYNFIAHEKIDFDWLDWLGLIRRERRRLRFRSVNRWHVC